MTILVPVVLLGIGLAALYYRFRENFSDLATATDSKRSDEFWSIMALVYAVVIAVLDLAV
jgi:hypothetical protein